MIFSLPCPMGTSLLFISWALSSPPSERKSSPTLFSLSSFLFGFCSLPALNARTSEKNVPVPNPVFSFSLCWSLELCMNVDCFLHFIWALGTWLMGFLMFRCLVFLGSNRNANSSSSNIHLFFWLFVHYSTLSLLLTFACNSGENALTFITRMGDFGKKIFRYMFFL